MAKRKIIFRADGGPAIGMGHFTRTLALAEMLRGHFHCVFATQQPTSYQANEINKVCHDIISLPADDTHFECFLALLSGEEIVVLDNYYFNTDYQRAIKHKGGKLVCVDDMHNKHFVADVVINHADGIDPSQYSIESGTKLLLGFKYALLRKEFFQDDQAVEEKTYSVFVMMGGADPANYTAKIAHLLDDMRFDLPVVVVIGNAYQHQGSLACLRNTKVYKNLSSEEVRSLMSQSTVGLLPASTVSIEACAVRLPFIVGFFVGNQYEIYHGLTSNHLALPVGDLNTMADSVIVESILKLYKDKKTCNVIMQSQSKRLDKKSPRRLTKEFQNLCH